MFRHIFSAGFAAALPLIATAQQSAPTEKTDTIRSISHSAQKIDHSSPKTESRFFKLQRSDAKDVQDELTGILAGKDTVGPINREIVRTKTTPDGLPLPTGAATETASTTVELNLGATQENFGAGKVKITADVRTNRIHVIALPVALKKIGTLIEKLDANVPFGEPSTYPLINAAAANVFEVLALIKAVSDTSPADSKGAQGVAGENNYPTANRNDLTADNAITIGATRVFADLRANAIVVVGDRAAKEKLFALIKKLDIRAAIRPPR